MECVFTVENNNIAAVSQVWNEKQKAKSPKGTLFSTERACGFAASVHSPETIIFS